jgi:hypothetical protein
MKKRYVCLLIFILCSGLLFAQTVTYVAPGDGTLSRAIADAADGDVLELAPGGVYTESSSYIFGTIENKSLTIDTEGDDPELAVLQIITPPDGETTIRYFEVGDNASLTLRDLDLDGSYGGAPSAEYTITFYMGEYPAPINVKNIRIENCHIHDFVSDVLAASSPEMRGNVIIDSTFVDHVIMERTGTSVYYKYAGADYISVTNSTFNTIFSYGFRVSGPLESNQPLHTPSVLIDHTTWYNIGTKDGREVILCEKGPHLGQWQVSNTICVKQINKDKTVINIKETATAEQAVIHNICLWDVGDRNWRDHPVSDTLNINPQFADPENGDFTLPAGSQLLTFGSDGGPIGDPRWATNATAVTAREKAMPLDFTLQQNYPNPFNPETTIGFVLDRDGNVTLQVFNLMGQKVAKLVNGFLPAGEYRYSFRADHLPSGIYIYELNTHNRVLHKKMTLLE